VVVLVPAGTITLVTLTAAYLVYRRFAGGDEATSVATLEV
jgi:hypothetical protein